MRKVCKNLNKRQLIKLKKRRKEENINVKKEQKTMQKMMKRKFKKEMGIKDGDSVTIAGWELEWED